VSGGIFVCDGFPIESPSLLTNEITAYKSKLFDLEIGEEL
jgi:hypothetical protein